MPEQAEVVSFSRPGNTAPIGQPVTSTDKKYHADLLIAPVETKTHRTASNEYIAGRTAAIKHTIEHWVGKVIGNTPHAKQLVEACNVETSLKLAELLTSLADSIKVDQAETLAAKNDSNNS